MEEKEGEHYECMASIGLGPKPDGHDGLGMGPLSQGTAVDTLDHVDDVLSPLHEDRTGERPRSDSESSITSKFSYCSTCCSYSSTTTSSSSSSSSSSGAGSCSTSTPSTSFCYSTSDSVEDIRVEGDSVDLYVEEESEEVHCDDSECSSTTAWVWMPREQPKDQIYDHVKEEITHLTGKQHKTQENIGEHQQQSQQQQHDLTYDLTDSSVCEVIRINSSRRNNSCPNYDFAFLVKINDEYTELLRALLKVRDTMKEQTPQRIRQHFDLAFKQVEALLQLQLELNESVRASEGDLSKLAIAFHDDRFVSYKRYILMMPRLQKRFNHHTSHFLEHFPTFRKDLLTPSLRVHFYSLVLKSFKTRGSSAEQASLDQTIEFLDLLNRRANTEMTVSTVLDCPVDLRLAGALLLVDEFYYRTGPLAKKKYTLVLFEHIVLFTLSNVTYFKMVAFYRPGQVSSVVAEGEKCITMDVKDSVKRQIVRHVFSPRNLSVRSTWLDSLQDLVSKCETCLSDELNVSQVQYEMLPLSLTSEYPKLQEALATTMPTDSSQSLASNGCVQALIVREEDYIYQLSNLLHAEESSLLDVVVKQLTQILNLHCKKILPRLKKSSLHGLSSVLGCFENLLDNLGIYSRYLALSVQIRSITATCHDPDQDPVVLPVHHFTHYLVFFSALGREAEPILSRLHALAALARTHLLTDAILDSCVDFLRCGKVLRCDTLRVTTPHKAMRDGIYQALLFTNLIILTKLRPPHYEYVCDIYLDEVNMGPLKASYPSAFKLEVRRCGNMAPISYVFRSHSQEVRDTWLAHLQKQFLSQAEAIKRQSTYVQL